MKWRLVLTRTENQRGNKMEKFTDFFKFTDFPNCTDEELIQACLINCYRCVYSAGDNGECLHELIAPKAIRNENINCEHALYDRNDIPGHRD